MKKNFNRKIIELTEFDADFCPDHLINREAAKQRGLTYDSEEQVYKDVDGCLVRDKYGQPLG